MIGQRLNFVVVVVVCSTTLWNEVTVHPDPIAIPPSLWYFVLVVFQAQIFLQSEYSNDSIDCNGHLSTTVSFFLPSKPKYDHNSLLIYVFGTSCEPARSTNKDKEQLQFCDLFKTHKSTKNRTNFD